MYRIRCVGIATAGILYILSSTVASAMSVSGELAAPAARDSVLQQARFYGGYGYGRSYYRPSYGYRGYGYPRYGGYHGYSRHY
jgi:hypothetical protein